MVEKPTISVPDSQKFIQIIYVPQTALHAGGSPSLNELMGVTRSGEVVIFNKTTRTWLPFTGG